MKIRFAFLSLAIAGTISSVSSAVSIPVTNYNFSDPLIPTSSFSGYYTPGTPNNWTAVGFAAQYYENATNGGFATGTPSSYSNVQPGITGPNNQYVADDGQGTLYQDLGVPFLPNKTYTVDVSGGHRSGFDGNTTTFGLLSSNTLITASTPAPLGGTAGFINEGALPTGTFALASAIGSPDAQVYTFTTGAVVPSGDVVVYVNNADGNTRLHVGEVFVSYTPEPASIGLVSLGAIHLLRRRRA